MQLKPRLMSIASKVKKDSFIADIGTDHAYIPIYLIRNGICKRAIATDIKKGPIEIAKNNTILYNMQHQIEIRQGSGFSPINYNEVDCAIMAGMGGHLICELIEKDKDKVNTIEYLIIQPMQFVSYVRKYLYNNNFYIFDEKLVKEDDKIYEIIICKHGKDFVQDDIYYEIGKKTIENNDELIKEFINKKICDNINIINKIDYEKSQECNIKKKQCMDKIEKYKEIFQQL